MGSIVTSREIAATPEKVFAAMTTPNRLAKWWGPEGFTNTFEICQMKPGGKWKFVMHGPDGKDYPNESEFGEIKSPEKFVVKHTCEPFFTATFTLAPSKKGTQLLWVCDFENDKFLESMRSFLETANQQNLDRLVKEVLGEDVPVS